MKTTPAYVSGGSNLDAERNLLLAARQLKASFPGVRFSRCYRNATVGFAGPDFINFVAGFGSQRDPHELRAELQRIERVCGRPEHAPRWEPRSMDLDLLLYGDRVLDELGLVLPRVDLLNWAFMLGPLAELAPAFVHPTLGDRIGDLWQRFDRDAHPLIPLDIDLNSA